MLIPALTRHPLLRTVGNVFIRSLLIAALLAGQILVASPAVALAQPADPSAAAQPQAGQPQFAQEFLPLNVAPIPGVTVNAGSPQLGSNFTISATFDNTGDETGYGPFIDLYIPRTGVDGIAPGDTPVNQYDGITPPAPAMSYAASYLGSSLTVYTLTFPDAGAGTGCVNHPLALDNVGFFRQVCGKAGDQLVVVVLPFGSFTVDQPAVTVQLSAYLSPLADLTPALNLYARGGFQFGRTPTVDWCCTVPVDTTILSGQDNDATTWQASAAVTPRLVGLTKQTSPPDNEIATGPNAPQTYVITLDVATGQTVNNLVVTDTLPDNLAYLGNLTVTPAGALDTASEPETGVPSGRTTDQLVVNLNPVTGAAGTDVTISFDYYIDYFDGGSQPVIDPVTGLPVTTPNRVSLVGDWVPVDTRDLGATGNVNVGPVFSTPTDKALALQKGYTLSVDNGAAGATPGDQIRYTVQFQVSDYFALDQLVFSDLLSDGQHFDPAATPTLTLLRDGSNDVVNLTPAFTTLTCNYTGAVVDGTNCNAIGGTTNGTTLIQFDLSGQLADGSFSDQALGGLVADGGSANDGPTRGTLVYYARVLDKFTDIFPSGDASINNGDSLSNAASLTGRLLDTATCGAGACSPLAPTTTVTDGDSVSIPISAGALEKSIYAVNAVVCATQPCADVRVSPGDLVTYRFTYDLFTGDYEQLTFTDFLPLPILKAADPNADNSSVTSWAKDVLGNATPAVGEWQRGPADTQFASQAKDPTVSASASSNTLLFDFGTYEDLNNNPLKIDILFTARITRDPFADGLYLTNQVRQQDRNTQSVAAVTDDVVRLQLTQPVLLSGKSAVSTDRVGVTPTPPIAPPISFEAPGNVGQPWTGGPINSTYLDAHPIKSTISGVDGGDQIKFLIVVQNVGSGVNGAFDILIQDVLKSGFIKPGTGAEGVNLQVYRGDGTALTYTNLDADSLFGAGIRIDDPGVGSPEYGKGACQGHDLLNGKNVVLVTYDLKVDPNAVAGQVIQNVGKLVSYSGSEGGPTYLPEPQDDSTDSQIGDPALAKTLLGTEFTDAVNEAGEAVIGELVTYEVKITLPEGSLKSLTLIDTLDAGLAFVDQTSVVLSNEDTDGAGPDTGIAFTGSSTPAVTNNGGTVTWSLGDVTNSDNDNAVAETITIVYRAVVLNVTGNQNTGPTRLNNAAGLQWNTLDAGGATVPASIGPVSAAEVVVIEPALSVTKTSTPMALDAGDALSFTVTLAKAGGSQADAFDITFSDPLPQCSGGASAITITDPLTALSVTNTTNPPVDVSTLFEVTGSNAAGWTLQSKAGQSFDLPFNTTGSIALSVAGTVSYCAAPNQLLTNNATVYWTSLDGAVTDRSTYNTASDERTGAQGTGGPLDNYAALGTVAPRVNNLAPVKALEATSELGTGVVASVTRVVVGEVLRYRIEVLVPEGTSPNFEVRDSLPSGLQYLVGTAQAALVSNGGGLSSSTFTGAGVSQNGNETNLATINPTVAFTPTNAGTGNAFGDGSDPWFNLGTLTNNDSDADAEYLVIEFNAVVLNVAGNQGNFLLRNNFTVWQGGTSLATSGNVDARVAEPVISIGKTAGVDATRDAGDTVTYTLTVTAASTCDGSVNNCATGHNLVVTDVLDSNLTNINVTGLSSTQGDPANPTTVCLGNGAGTTDFDLSSTVSAQTVSVNASCLDPGRTITITIQAQLVSSLPAGYTLPNTGNLTYTSLPGTNGTVSNPTGSTAPGAPGDATGERIGTTGVNNYTSTSSAPLALSTPSIVKQAPASTGVAVGSEVTYPILVTLPEGLTRAVRVVDAVPAGMQFVRAEMANISTGMVLTNNPPLVSPAAPVNGDDVTLDFGDVTTPVDPAANTFTVNVTLLLLDVSANQIGAGLINSASLIYKPGLGAGDTTLPGGSQSITVVEPRIVTVKTVNPTSGVNAGDILTYTVRFTNTGDSIAYDVSALDALAQGTDSGFIAVTSCKDQTVTDVSTAVTPGSGTLLFDGPWDIAVGGFVECVYTAVVQPAVYLDGTHTNLIDADWYSGDDAGGRFYDDTPRTVDTDLDDDDAVFSTGAATLTKTVDTSTPTIGQTVTYTLTLNAPLGTLRLAQIVDTLQAGLRYVPGSQTITSGTISAPAFSETVGMLTWDFGDAVISAVPVVIQYQAVVENIDPNQDGQIRDNNVVLNYLDAQENPKNVTDTRVVTLTEPGLQIVKDIIAIPAAPDAGDLVTYRLTISHNAVSTANAYDLVVVDTLPASLDLQEGSITVTPNTGVTNNSSDALNQLSLDVAALPLGGTLVVEYQAQLIASLAPGSTVDNTANLSWTSMPGANVDERQGLIEDQLNNYLAFEGASFGSSSYTLTKYLVAPVDAAPVVGETVTYALNVGLPEGLSANVNVADALPAGLSYLSYSVETSGYGVTLPFNGSIDPAPAVTAPGGSGGDFAVLFASVQPAADNNPDNNNFVVLVNAVVVNEIANQDGTVLTNSATLQVGQGPTVSGGPVDVTVTEPVLTIDKTAPAAVVNPGQTLTYTLTLDNPAATSTADAFDVVLTDTLPAGLTASNINAPAGWTSNYNAATGVITLQGDLPLGQQALFTYDVTVGASVTVGSNLTNNVAVTWTSLAGAIAGERTGADGPGGTLNDYAVQDSLTINYTGVDLSIAKTDGGVTAVPGGQVTYQLSLANLGNLDATNVVLTESLPTHTTLVGPAGWTCVASSCTYAFGALAAGATATVDFIVQVNATLPASVEQLSNTVSITSTELDPHQDNNTSGDTTPLDAAPQLTVTKTDSLSIVGPDSTLTYLITVTNTGNQNATGIVLTDTLPGVVSFVSTTGSPVLAGGVLTWPAFDLAAGANRTFNVTVKVAAEPSLSYVENIVAVTDDGSNTGGTPVTDSDTDRDEIADTQVKTFLSTSHADTGGNQVAIGERITYVITLDVPPGTMNDLTATDVMMRGLAFDGCVSIDAGSLTTNLTNGFSDACADPTNPVVSAEPAGSSAAADQGRRVVFTFGDVTNAGEVPVTLTVTYEAAVLNVAENINGRDDLANVVSWAWDGGGLSGSATPAEVVEPELALDKTAANPIVPVGQIATFTLTVAHTPESTAAAYNVVIQDRLPVGLTYVPGSLRIVSGPAGGVANESGAPLLTVTWPVFGLTDTAEVTYQAIFLSEKNSTNAAAAYWTSLPIDPSNPYNQEGGYRGYVPGDSVNDYVAESSVRIREPEELPNTGFAPGVVTTLPAQPADKGYQQLDGITLEIPALGLTMPVVGVPLTADGWDLTWLDDQAGYLAGTAFPGVVGTTGITAHATTPDGKAGPFIHLGRLKWGDVIIVHAGGYRYQYEVRQNRLIQPDDLSVLSNDGYVWLTLLTCKGFNEKDGSYLQRVAVRAVLLKVTAEQ